MCLVFVLVTPTAATAGEANAQRLTLAGFQTYLQRLKTERFKDALSGEDFYRLKRTAETLSDKSWAAILQLWVVGEIDFVRLLWWQKDDTETRAFIVALEWCPVGLPAAKDGPWPGGLDDFKAMAKRFENQERELRVRETNFVREHRAMLAKELGLILSRSGIAMAKRYEVSSIVQVVDNIVLIEGLVPKRGEPQTDPYAVAIISLGTNAGPFLVGKLTDGGPSKWFYGFQYKIADIADTLLSDIYHQWPRDALIRRKPPLDSGQGYYFRDYAALTETAEGREALRAAWKRIVEEPSSREGHDIQHR